LSGNISDIPPEDGGAAAESDVPPGAICTGARFATYTLEELVGVGSTASIYRARDGRLLREVAIKIWTSGAPAGANGLARFLHEARMAAAVRHPNVVSIFDVGVHDGSPYIVMELLSGEDLDERLRVSRALPEPAVIDLALPLVAGLVVVQDAGVVHRDLKPSNIFLSRGPNGDVQPTLLDFGVSKRCRDSLRLTTLGRQRWAAMPLYTSPEVLLGGDATFRSDQYSLGVLLYECVTGVNPFRADSARDSIELITSGQYLPASAHGQRASRGLAKIIERAMSPDPEERFADLRELGRALLSVAGRRARATWSSAFGTDMVASSMGTPLPRRAQVASAPRRRRGLAAWALGAAVAGWSIAGVLSAWFLAGVPRTTTPATITAASSPAAIRAAASVEPASSAAEPAPPRVPASEHGVAGEPVAMAHQALHRDPAPGGLPLPPAAGAGPDSVPSGPGGYSGSAASEAPPLAGEATGAPAQAEVENGAIPPSEPGTDDPAALVPDDTAMQQPPEGLVPAGQEGELPALNPDGSLAVPGEMQPPAAAGALPPDPERGTNGALIFD
jgi:eukaryotic-like serine/threonine-protein kinase